MCRRRTTEPLLHTTLWLQYVLSDRAQFWAINHQSRSINQSVHWKKINQYKLFWWRMVLTSCDEVTFNRITSLWLNTVLKRTQKHCRAVTMVTRDGGGSRTNYKRQTVHEHQLLYIYTVFTFIIQVFKCQNIQICFKFNFLYCSC